MLCRKHSSHGRGGRVTVSDGFFRAHPDTLTRAHIKHTTCRSVYCCVQCILAVKGCARQQILGQKLHVCPLYLHAETLSHCLPCFSLETLLHCGFKYHGIFWQITKFLLLKVFEHATTNISVEHRMTKTNLVRCTHHSYMFPKPNLTQARNENFLNNWHLYHTNYFCINYQRCVPQVCGVNFKHEIGELIAKYRSQLVLPAVKVATQQVQKRRRSNLNFYSYKTEGQ